MGSPNGAHAGWEEEDVVLGDGDSPYALRNHNLAISSALVAHEHARDAAAQGTFCLFGRGDIKVTSIALFEIQGLVDLVRFQRLRTVGRRGARQRRSRGVVAMCHGLGARGGRRGRDGRCEGGEDVRGEAAGDAEAGVLPELLGGAEAALGEQHEKDAEGFGDAVLHDAGGGDVACGQECAACFCGFAGWEKKRFLGLYAEFLFQDGRELYRTQEAEKISMMPFLIVVINKLLTFWMFRCMKNRGYPVCIALRTRGSPSS
jgi:hypothetical protein